MCVCVSVCLCVCIYVCGAALSCVHRMSNDTMNIKCFDRIDNGSTQNEEKRSPKEWERERENDDHWRVEPEKKLLAHRKNITDNMKKHV